MSARRGRRIGIERHRAGDGDALALAAGKLVGIAVERRRIEAGVGERAVGDAAALGGAQLRPWAMSPSSTISATDMRGDKRTVRVLENDLHLASERPHRLGIQAVDRAPAIDDRSVGPDKPQDRETQRRLARARFADDPDRLPLAHGKRNTVDRFDVRDSAAEEPFPDRKPDLEVLRTRHRRRRPVGWRRSPLGSADMSARV